MKRRTGSTAIKTKMTTFVVVTLGLLVALVGTIQFWTSLDRVEEIEDEQAVEHVDRITRQLDNSLSDLGGTNSDWAWWDDSYDFVQDGNQDYRDENLYAEAFTPLGVDLVVYVDLTGTVVADVRFIEDDEVPAPAEVIDLARPGARLGDFTEVPQATPSGIVEAGGEAFLVTSRAILPSELDGPPVGVLLMGRHINGSFASQLADLTRLDMSIEPCSADECAGLSSEPQITKTSSSITATAALASIDGTPALRAQVREPRTMYEESLDGIIRVLVVLIAVGIVAVVITIAGLRRLLIRPLERLGSTVAEVARTNDPSVRATVGRTDEIGDLAAGINVMLARLENSQQLLVEAKQQIEGASEAKSRFLSHVSHELRTPINGVLAYAQLLQLDELDGESGESVEQIITAARHITALVDEYLDIARIEAGAIPLTIETVTAAAIATEVVSMTQPLAAARSIAIDLADPDDALVLADAVRLRQVLLNLVSNAIKYGGDDQHVEVAVERRGRRTTIHVIDHGPGIPDHQLCRLFVPFDRLDADRTERQGSGIGLSVTKQLVELMNGTIEVASELGTGTTLSVTLPSPVVPNDVQPDQKGLQGAGSSSIH